MKIHEYQGKAVLAQYGVPVPKGKVAYTVDEAVEAAKGLGFPVVVKAQIHAGGRGKGGGVKLAKGLDECEAIAKAMLGMTLRTHQTGPEGRLVRRLLIEHFDGGAQARLLLQAHALIGKLSGLHLLAGAIDSRARAGEPGPGVGDAFLHGALRLSDV